MASIMAAKVDKQQLWSDTLESLRVTVSAPIYNTWISQTHLISLKKIRGDRQMAEIGCNSTFVKSTIENRYFGLVQDALIKNLGSPVDLTFIVKQSPEQPSTENSQKDAPLFAQEDNEAFQTRLATTQVLPYLTFENFAVSGTNQMAWAAAEAVANQPGQAYNPLFVWGGVGVGKTHLMNAIGHRAVKNGQEAVLLCTGETFTNDIVQGIRNKTTQVFRNKYRKVKVLMIDDIQFIAGKDAVQEEFFHTFNAVAAAGGQVVMTSDQPPTSINNLEERLKSRFEAGLTVDISQPDFELKCAIIQIKAAEKGLKLPTEVVHLVAGNVNTARKIQGIVTRIESETKLKKTLPTEDLVKSILSKGGPNSELAKSKATPQEVIQAVIKYFSLTKKDLLGKRRSRAIARPRQILMYLLRVELGLPYEEVGKYVGRDHSTVIHAVDRIQELASANVNIYEDISGIKNTL